MAGDIGTWLDGLGLGRYADAFRENEIDLDALPYITEDDLKGIGIALGARRKLLAAMAALLNDESEAASESSNGDTMTEPALSSERRQVTVLFADLAGFTRLSDELGAEATHTLLNRYFETVDAFIESYGGCVDKHMGDNVMAVFGAPVAHDNDPERALRAAFDIHQALADLSAELGRELKAHIGIASGQVVASGTGSESHREYTVTGSSVNLASRLQGKAAGGETLISQAVHRAVSDLAETAPMGEIEVKGFSEPVVAWRAKGLSGNRDAAHRTPLVGRRAERRQFATLIEECLETDAGQAILVRGEAGIGKTRLVEEFQRIAAKRGFASHRGLILDFGVGKGRDAVRSLVRSLLDIPPGANKTVRQDAAEAVIADGVLASDQRLFLYDLLDLPQPLEDRAMYDAMENATRNAGKRTVVTDLIRNASASAPLVVVIEDVHWADTLTLNHLAAMAGTVSDCRVVLVMTSRIDGDPLDAAWRARAGGCPLMTIDLGPLREAEALDFAGSFVDATHQFVQDCIARAGGNPLFLEQLLRNAEEQGDEEIPASIQSLVLARMDRLTGFNKRALQAASVIGQRFTQDLLGHLIDDPDYDLAGLLEQHLVRPEGDGYLFTHALIRDGVYASLLNAARQDLHRRAAMWFADLDLVLRAQHLECAGDSAAPGAYLEAARAQAAIYHYDHALNLVARGAELTRDGTYAFDLVSFKGQLLNEAGQVQESLEAYRESLGLAEDETDRCKSLIGLAAGLRLSNESADALTYLEEAEPIALEHDLKHDLARLYHLRGNLNFGIGNVDACSNAHERALTCAREAGSLEAEARSLGGVADAAYARGRMVTAHRYFSDCVALSRKLGFGRIEVANLGMVGWSLHFLNQLQASLDITMAAAESSRKVGDRRAELNATSCAVYVMHQMGEMSGAPRLIERVQDLVAHLGARAWEPTVGWHWAEYHSWEGRVREAAEVIQAAIATARETSVGFMAPRMLGFFATITDDPDARKAALDEAEAMLREGSLGHNSLGMYAHAIEANLKSGDWDAVEKFAALLEDFTRPEPLPSSDFFIARGRALAAHRRGRRDEATMRELKRLRDEAIRTGLRPNLPALEEALATA